MRKTVLLILLLITYLLLRPILGDIWYPVHDTTSVARTYLLAKTLASGQIPAVWAAELNGGAGYPLFHFYAPASIYLALLGKTLSGSYFTGIKITLALAALSGMLGMYMLTRKWGRGAALVAAVSYGLLPYAAVNIYVRGAFAEYLAMGLLPWVFYLWQELKVTRSQMVTALVTSLFVLSHNLIPLITVPFLAAWILIHHKHNLKQIMLPAVMTLSLAAFYLAPLLLERHFVVADQVARTTDYAKHFVMPSQLWNSTWGYGGSDTGVEDGMSFKVGKIALLLAGLSSLVVLMRRQGKVVFFVIAAAISLYMTTPYAAFFWDKIPYLALVQFPWRFLTLAGFFVSILAGYALTLIGNKLVQGIVAIATILLVVLFHLKLFVPQAVFPAQVSQYTNTKYLSTIPAIIPEYSPRWLSGEHAPVEGSTVLPYYYYPTWQVTLEGKRVATYPSQEGYLTFANPEQSPNFDVVQDHTQIENWATIISLIALVVTIKLYVKN